MTSSPVDARIVATPQARSIPPCVDTAGHEAIELAAQAGLIMDPWQQQILVDGLGEREDGKWSAFEVALIVGRQNGKGSVLEARVLAGLALFDERLILWSAHETKTAFEGFRRMAALVEGNEDLRRRVAKITYGAGLEGIEFRNGARLRFVARSKGSGRGFSSDLIILDEAYALTADQMAAMIPTLSSRPNPQIWYTSSPPLDGESGDQLYALRKRAAAGDRNLCWHDWGVQGVELDHLESVDLDDRGTWAATNPALGIRITEDFVARERATLSDEAFARERLGIWPPRGAGGQRVIDLAEWDALADPQAPGGDVVALAIDVTPDGGWSAIVAVGDTPSGVPRIKVLDHGAGTGWVVGRALLLKERLNPVCWVLDDKSGASRFLLPLEKAGIVRMPPVHDDPRQGPQRGQLWVPTVQQLGAACGSFTDAVRQGKLLHLAQQELSVALDGAKTRPLGDGAWAWGRKIASADISPLVGATLALAGLERWRHLARPPQGAAAAPAQKPGPSSMFRPTGRLSL